MEKLLIYSLLLFCLAYFCESAILHAGIRRSIGAGVMRDCTPQLIKSQCAAGDMSCLKLACSDCIMRDELNPFASYCVRLTACVCSIFNNSACVEKIEEDCY